MNPIVLADQNTLVGHILVIGAGSGAALPVYRDLKPSQLTLVEPTPQSAARLRALCADQDAIDVIQAAITTAPQPQMLHQFNFAALNSLRQPTGFLDHYPGLIAGKQVQVTCMTPADLVAQLQLPKNRHNILVIDTAGETLNILQAIEDAGVLDRFTTIRVREGVQPLYADGPTMDIVGKWLAARGYRFARSYDNRDPDCLVLTVSFDFAAAHRKACEQLSEAQGLVDELRSALEKGNYQQRVAQHHRKEAELVTNRLQVDMETLQMQHVALQHQKAEQDQLLAQMEAVLTELVQELTPGSATDPSTSKAE